VKFHWDFTQVKKKSAIQGGKQQQGASKQEVSLMTPIRFIPSALIAIKGEIMINEKDI
jgi:hypothetical protein